MKRKILALVVILIAPLLMPTLALATVDLATMSNVELIELTKTLAFELTNRGKSLEVAVGDYVVGVDIPEGEYILTYTEGTQGGIFTTGTPGDPFGEHFMMLSVNDQGTDREVTLYNGDYVNITIGPVILTKKTAAPFKYE